MREGFAHLERLFAAGAAFDPAQLVQAAVASEYGHPNQGVALVWIELVGLVPDLGEGFNHGLTRQVPVAEDRECEPEDAAAG